MTTFPISLPEDPEAVLVALEVGRAMWERGDRRDAVKWLRQAVDDAFDAGLDARGLDLSKQAAGLASDPSLAPPPAAEGLVDLELPGRAAAVPATPLRSATGRHAAIGRASLTPPEGVEVGARRSLPSPAEARPSMAPPVRASMAPLARVALERRPAASIAPARSLVPPPPEARPVRPEPQRAWGAATALRVALRACGGEVKARVLAEGELAGEGELEATVLAPGADGELRALFDRRLDATG